MFCNVKGLEGSSACAICLYLEPMLPAKKPPTGRLMSKKAQFQEK